MDQRYLDANNKALAVETGSGSGSVVQDEEKDRNESEHRLAQLQHQLPSNEPSALRKLIEDSSGVDEETAETQVWKNLFKNMKFFLSREVPRESLLFVIFAFGGTVSWEGEGAPFDETDKSITHQIADRPSQGHKFLSQEYVQPQFDYDCVNALTILQTESYMVGRVPPPHLSPFVDNEAECYVPEYADTIIRLQAAVKKEVMPMYGVGKDDLNDPHNLLADGVINQHHSLVTLDIMRSFSDRRMAGISH